MPRKSMLQIRRGTTEEWLSRNPVLAVGEPGVDIELHELRIGDGSSRWSDLKPIGGADIAHLITAITIGEDGTIIVTRENGETEQVGSIPQSDLKEYSSLAELDAVSTSEVGWLTTDLTPVVGVAVGEGSVFITTQSLAAGIVLQHLWFTHPAATALFSRYGLTQPDAAPQWLTAFTSQRLLPTLDSITDQTEGVLVGGRSGTYQYLTWYPLNILSVAQSSRSSGLRDLSSMLQMTMTPVGVAVATGIRDMGRVIVNLGKRSWASPGIVLTFSNQGFSNAFLPEFGVKSSNAPYRVRYFEGRNDDGTVGSRFKLYDNGYSICLEALTSGMNQNLIFEWPVDVKATATAWPGTPVT